MSGETPQRETDVDHFIRLLEQRRNAAAAAATTTTPSDTDLTIAALINVCSSLADSLETAQLNQCSEQQQRKQATYCCPTCTKKTSREWIGDRSSLQRSRLVSASLSCTSTGYYGDGCRIMYESVARGDS